ncbi:ubiquitin fusion degradation protein [Apiospora kogelbergensis]|uniref:Ubiquitin fusion degradation protein n=1 Tax=Apiospora kogelbergensis TaxID=1337665 RepID=A0AAW0R720_9PEZI
MYRPGFNDFDPDDPQSMYMAARGMSRRPGMQRFDEYYRCYPIIMGPGPERPEFNYGSKILLPVSALDKVSKLHVQWPLTLELVNGALEKHTHAGVLEFTAEEGRAYIPQWMMQTLGLDVGDMIQVKTTSLSPAKLVKLQPQSTNFLDISDPKAVLEKAFRSFATLTLGDVFNFEYNDEIYDMAVMEVKPTSEKMGVSMIETDVEVDFAAPLGYVEPERRAGSGTSTPRSAIGGTGVPVGGVLRSQGTMAQSINYDALKPESTQAAAGAQAVSSHFISGGHKLNAKNKGTSTPLSTTSSNPGAQPPMPRRTNGPMPLRIGPNKLFFGYDIVPLKTDADKEAEKENASRPHFAGQGQTLRGGAVKRKPEQEDKGKAPEKKPSEGHRLDGRKG